MNSNNSNNNSNSEDNFDWASRLERLRQSRQINAPYTHAPLVRESEDKPRTPKMQTKELDAKSRDRVLQAHMLKWQQEHNAMIEQQPREEVETDDMVLLQENWLNAQAALQMKASDRQIESTQTVWFNPKRGTVEFFDPSEASAQEQQQEGVSDGVDMQMPSENQDEEPRVVVNLNVLNPQVIRRSQVFCLSEQELGERLIKRMRPHVTDAVNGMIRVAIQKQMALMAHNLQQMMNEQAPQLVEEVLEHNVKRVLEDIKHEMKYKRS